MCSCCFFFLRSAGSGEENNPERTACAGSSDASEKNLLQHQDKRRWEELLRICSFRQQQNGVHSYIWERPHIRWVSSSSEVSLVTSLWFGKQPLKWCWESVYLLAGWQQVLPAPRWLSCERCTTCKTASRTPPTPLAWCDTKTLPCEDRRHASRHRELSLGYLGTAVPFWKTGAMLAVTLSNVELLSGGATLEPDMRITKLPMPTQKAMTRPASKPTTAP